MVLPWTIAIYVGFLFVYGETIFDTDWGATEGEDASWWDKLFGFLEDTISFTGDLLQFATLGGFETPLPSLLRAILLFGIGLPWFLIIVGIGRGHTVS